MLKNIAKAIETGIPSREDAALAEQSSRALAAYVNSKHNPSIVIHKGKKQDQVVLPAEALRLLVDILTQMAEGNAVTIVPIHNELSTQEAAVLLNVSRPFFVNLLEEGKIPYTMVGTHRRVLAKDVLNYKSKIDDKRLKSLAKLTDETQKLIGYE